MDKQAYAKTLVFEYLVAENGPETSIEDVFIVWFCKTLQNWKALVSSSLPDSPYFEVTHNGDKNETYLDVYQKVSNVVFPIRES